MPADLCSSLLAKIHEQIERTVHLIGLLPAGNADWAPPEIAGAWPVSTLVGHLLECLAGHCAVLAAAYPEPLAHFIQLRDRPSDSTDILARMAVYRAHIEEGFALLTDDDLSRRLPTVFVPEGETIHTLLLGNLEHLINHKHQLFTWLKLMGIEVGTPDLYRFRGTARARFTLRQATPADVPALRALIDASVRGLQRDDYTPEQIDRALRSVYGVDSQLIADGTYYLVESGSTIVGCGGWSQRKTLYGGDQFHGREDALLDPATDAAKIRAFFVHPDWGRRGIASMILTACENAAQSAGFSRFEMGATLTGVPFYQSKGYVGGARLSVPLLDAAPLTVIHMEKKLGQTP